MRDVEYLCSWPCIRPLKYGLCIPRPLKLGIFRAFGATKEFMHPTDLDIFAFNLDEYFEHRILHVDVNCYCAYVQNYRTQENFISSKQICELEEIQIQKISRLLNICSMLQMMKIG